MIRKYAESEDRRGLTQILTTLGPYAIIWWAAVEYASVSAWVVATAVPLLVLFTLRVFALMHECGHGSLFRRPLLNRWTGFLLGVISGMPQYVWSQHHNYHHAHNGDWQKYRGPYSTLSIDEYSALTGLQQRMYRHKCSIAAAPLAGFIYLIFNPRLTWIRGTCGLVLHIVGAKRARTGASVRECVASYRTRLWKTTAEYRHMFWNNVVLLSAWAVMVGACGAALFFLIYLLSVSIAGGVGIVLFAVQHNFEHAHATDSERWDPDTGAIEGTSFLVLPAWLNWFTINIGYHHIHHLSAAIPNYRLAQCHHEYKHLFREVVRLSLSKVYGAMQCILWDVRAQRIITLAEYREQIRGSSS